MAPPGQSLCQWLLPHWTLSSAQWGGWGQGGLQTTPDGISSSTPPYYILSGLCSWISPSFPGSSRCNLIFLSPLQGQVPQPVLFGGPHIWWPDFSPLSCLSFPSGGHCFSRNGGLLDGALPWLQMPVSPSTLGGLQGRTAPLQVVLVPQEETLEVNAVCNPPGIAPIVLPWKFLAPPAEWQVCLPLGSAEANSAGSLGG